IIIKDYLKTNWKNSLMLMVLFIGVVLGVYLVGKQTKIFSQAALPKTPQNVIISNITDSSFTLSWTTQESTFGYVAYGKTEPLDNISLDDRDSSDSQKRFTHFITIKNLDPETDYLFRLGSDDKVYSRNNSSYTIKTLKTPKNQKLASSKVFGTVKTSGDGSEGNALVYVRYRNNLLSAVTNPDGTYAVELNISRNQDLDEYIPVEEDDELKMLATSRFEAGVGKFLGRRRHWPVDIKLELQEVPIFAISYQPDEQVAVSEQNSQNVTSPTAQVSFTQRIQNFVTGILRTLRIIK
ncbi:MAG: fibronectin type III domain-containing protein, partial [Nanoarchaeota archaeon]